MNLKEKITRGWQVSAEGYSALVQEDFQEETRRAWLELILNRAPQERNCGFWMQGQDRVFLP